MGETSGADTCVGLMLALEKEDSMVVKGMIKTGAYFDSVTLMIVGRELSAKPGISDAAVVMGTAENKAILKSSGLLVPGIRGRG